MWQRAHCEVCYCVSCLDLSLPFPSVTVCTTDLFQNKSSSVVRGTEALSVFSTRSDWSGILSQSFGVRLEKEQTCLWEVTRTSRKSRPVSPQSSVLSSSSLSLEFRIILKSKRPADCKIDDRDYRSQNTFCKFLTCQR